MPSKLEDFVTISPQDWPSQQLPTRPGDLSLFAPTGIGLSGPFPIRPWDDPFKSPAGFYGYTAPSGHPFLGAPVTDAAGGTVYFDGSPDQQDVEAMLRLMRVHQQIKDYAAFVGKAAKVVDDGYIVQLRLVSRFALQLMFGATGPEVTSLSEQKLSVGEMVWKFIEQQREEWGTGYSHQLDGCMGGDGDWARETLAFGFMVENGYQGIYRVWSRAWLVTK